MNSLYAVIMAGGSGTRFWPLSRNRTPKQVLSIIGPNSLLQDTVKRISDVVPQENIYIVTHSRQKRVIAQQIPEFDEQRLILEPSPRNTAPCIGLVAFTLRRIDPEAIMIVMPSDHLVRDVKGFQKAVRTAVEVAKKTDGLVTFGIPPTRIETGYGYIQFEPTDADLPASVHRVKAFAEKPNWETAKRFVESGEFYWNSGIFIWSVSRILKEMEEHLPEQYHQLEVISRAWGQPSYKRVLYNRWARIRAISIDYGVMEVATSPIYMVEGNFGWSDIGSWDELYRLHRSQSNNNVIFGEATIIDGKDNLIYSPSKMTAVVGLDNLIVVNTPTATLICPLNRAQDVKQLVEKMKIEGKERYL